MMKKELTIVVVAVLLMLVIGLSGCEESTEEENELFESGFLTAQDLIDDVWINLTEDMLVIDYKSFEINDSVTIHDIIDDVVYLEDTNITQIIFNVEPFDLLNSTATNLTFDFRGNLTQEFIIGDKVNISFHLRWVHIATLAGNEIIFEFDLEGAEELAYDGSQEQLFQVQELHTLDSIRANFPPDILPESCITHV